MKRLGLAAFAVVLVVGSGAARAQFQPPSRPNYGPGYRPQLSPYLNLIRGGDPAANYYLGTLPEFQRRSNAQLFSSEISDLDRRVFGAIATQEQRLEQPLPGTGHPTAFGYTGYYYGGTPPPGTGQRASGTSLPGHKGRP
jgi:hypothetical protein